jgi:hypothetical protein
MPNSLMGYLASMPRYISRRLQETNRAIDSASAGL